VPFYGAVVACVDDTPVREIVPRFTRRTITYGFAEDAAVRGVDPSTDGWTARCRVECAVRGVAGGSGRGEITLAIPGRHALQNALAAVAVGLELGVPLPEIAHALSEFRGAERRYQLRGRAAGVTVVDDYGHHPTEIAAVLRAARAGGPARLVAVFQPHRYSRTRDLFGDFGPALSLADVVVLADIYPAGEAPIAGVTLEAFAAEVARAVPELHVVPAVADLPGRVAAIARPGDLVITLGAGSIGTVPDRLLAALDAAGDTRAARRSR
jgi:UDP-N-acetylmuramate--alanine ligase